MLIFFFGNAKIRTTEASSNAVGIQYIRTDSNIGKISKNPAYSNPRKDDGSLIITVMAIEALSNVPSSAGIKTYNIETTAPIQNIIL